MVLPGGVQDKEFGPTHIMAADFPSRSICELTYLDVQSHLKASSILCLPIGSIEQHGPHLPLNKDAVLATEYARRIVARWGDIHDVWLLPTLNIGLAREHEWAPGTLSLSVQGMTMLVHELGRSIRRSLPARNLAIVNGHGGNRGILEALAQDLRSDCGLHVCIMHPAVWAEADSETVAAEIHAGRNETSMMLAAAPHLVVRERIAQLRSVPDENAVRAKILDPAVTWPWTTDDGRLADLGVIGDATAASAELGETLLAKITEAAGGVLKQLLARQRPNS